MRAKYRRSPHRRESYPLVNCKALLPRPSHNTDNTSVLNGVKCTFECAERTIKVAFHWPGPVKVYPNFVTVTGLLHVSVLRDTYESPSIAPIQRERSAQRWIVNLNHPVARALQDGATKKWLCVVAGIHQRIHRMPVAVFDP